jgi:PAS domain S-box-containing protein
MNFNISRILQRRAFTVLIIAVIFIFSLLTWWVVFQTHREMLNNLLLQTRLVAETINHRHIKNLTGSSADLKNPVYRRLKEQFATVRQIEEKYRFIYLLGRRANGKIFFFVDSKPFGSADESPAGQIYEEATNKLLSIFETGRADTEGPVTDRWGTFFSSMIPVVDPATNKVIAVLGVDADAGNWNQKLFRAALPPAFFMLLLIALLLAGAALLARRNRLSVAAPRWMNFLEIALTALVGLLLTIFAAWMLNENERRDRHEAFSQLAESQTFIMSEILRDIRDYGLEGLARFYEGSEHVKFNEFTKYTDYLINNPAVQVWGWIPAVSAAQKSLFEKTTRASGLTGFEIWQEGKKGNRIPASRRNTYYPLSYVNPLKGNEKALGYDLGSEPLRQAALTKAADTGLTICSEPITLMQETADRKGLLIFRPVFSKKGSRNLQGFTSAVLFMDKLLESVSKDIVSTQIEISLLRADNTIEILAVTHDAAISPDTGFSLARPVFAYGKVFSIKAYADAEFMDAYPPRAALFAILAGLILTATLTFVLGMIIHRRTLLEQMVDLRTRELQESESLYKKIFENHAAIKLLIDPDTTNIIEANEAAEKFYGWPREKLKHMKISEINTLSPEDIKNEIEKSKAGEKIYFEFRHRRADGSIKDVNVFSSKIEIKGKEFLHSIVHDVTEGKKAEETLRIKNLAFDTSIAANSVADAEGIIIEANESFIKLWGYKNKEDVIGNPISHFFKDIDEASGIVTSLNNNGHWQGNFTAKKKDGLTFLANTMATVIQDKTGKIIGYQSSVSDITERIKPEEEVKRLTRDLEKRVAQRTEELHKSQLALLNVVDDLNENAKKLAAANEALEALNKELEAFAYSVSHDLRAPLRSIDGFSVALLEDYSGKLDKTGKDYLQRVRRAAQNMGELIDDLLKLSRVNKADFRPVSVNLSKMAAETADTLKKQTGRKNIKVEIQADLTTVADPALLQIALTNLIGNAFKFTGKKEKTFIEFSARQEGKQNIFYVRDNGAGFDMTYANKLFAPFQRLHNFDEFEGTGIGLATVQRIIHRHGGKVWAEGEVNKGATFYFTLPETRTEKGEFSDEK